MTGRARRSRRGFTLVEMLVVMCILAVVATIGSLRLRRRNLQLESSALVQDLFLRATRARLLALGGRCQVRIAIDPADANSDGLIATLQVATQSGFSPVPLDFGAAVDQVSTRGGAAITGIARGESIGGAAPSGAPSATTLTFYPDGSARLSGTGAAGATIFVRDEQGHNQERLVIFGRTGMAKVLAQ